MSLRVGAQVAMAAWFHDSDGGLSTHQIYIKYSSKYKQIRVYLVHEVEVRVFTMIFDAYLLYLSPKSKYAYLNEYLTYTCCT